jgi:hypothetical protein
MERWKGASAENRRMSVAHYRIYELDRADHIVDGYSVMCLFDAAALAMADNGAKAAWSRSRCGRATDGSSGSIRLRPGRGSGGSGPASRLRCRSTQARPTHRPTPKRGYHPGAHQCPNEPEIVVWPSDVQSAPDSQT